LREKSPRPYLIHHLHGLSYFDYLAVVTERMRGHVDLGFLFLKLKGYFPVKWDAEGARYADIIIAQNIRDQDYIEDQRARQTPPDAHAAPVVQVAAALHPRLELAGRSAPLPESRPPTSLLWFGSWRERKGHAYVARAFREVKEQFPEATLTIGGVGGDAASVPGYFDAELRSSVRVLPRIEIDEQIREYYAHGIFIFPSLSEGFGLALIEAMTMGLACVTTQTGVGSDFIEDGVHAVVVAMASSRHLARGIIRLIRDDALRRRIALQGQQLARQFTVERSVNEYLDIFEKRPGARIPG
jgi:glycosyltransferase involved in cell wall biosynthesis